MKKQPPRPRPREVEAFLEMLQAERGAAKNTLAAYGADLDNVMGFLARRKQGPVNADAEGLPVAPDSPDFHHRVVSIMPG